MSKLRTISITRQIHSQNKRLRTLPRHLPKHQQPYKSNHLKHIKNIKCHTDIGENHHSQDVVYNKNISYFRELFNPNNTSILPFLSSLRKNKDYKQIPMTITATNPFEVSEKCTLNQITKKSSNDIEANAFRLSKISYRWSKGSGLGIKANCQFECGLRLSKDVKNPELSTFINSLEPIRYCDVQQKRYKARQLKCQRQRRLFTLQV